MKIRLFLVPLLVFVLISFVFAEVCTDSDNGKNYYVKGDATFIHPTTGSLFNETDFCMSESVLSEQYCKSDYEIDHVVYRCPNGCSNGACVGIPPAPAIPRCLSGEYGERINYYQKGNASYIDSNTGNLIFEEDFCMNNVTLSKQSCKKVFDGNTLLRVTLENNAFRCPNGCSNGACLFTNSTQQNSPVTLSSQENCAGCKLDNQCYPLGYRKGNMFCADINEFVEQKRANLICENNFECSSNVCVSGKCVSRGLLDQIINWFKRLFGAE